jgi:dipeptide/tripeptide permease
MNLRRRILAMRVAVWGAGFAFLWLVLGYWQGRPLWWVVLIYTVAGVGNVLFSRWTGIDND